MGTIILEHADCVVKVNEGTTGGTNSQFVRVKCSAGAQMLNTAKSIYPDLDIMSQECGWHCMKRCGCLSNRERPRASKHALFCSRCVFSKDAPVDERQSWGYRCHYIRCLAKSSTGWHYHKGVVSGDVGEGTTAHFSGFWQTKEPGSWLCMFFPPLNLSRKTFLSLHFHGYSSLYRFTPREVHVLWE